jgi:pilus assembly protein Flp/PilA
VTENAPNELLGRGHVTKEKKMKEAMLRLVREDDGATAIEYGLIAGLVAVVVIGALAMTGDSLQAIFYSIGESLQIAAKSS